MILKNSFVEGFHFPKHTSLPRPFINRSGFLDDAREINRRLRYLGAERILRLWAAEQDWQSLGKLLEQAASHALSFTDSALLTLRRTNKSFECFRAPGCNCRQICLVLVIAQVIKDHGCHLSGDRDAPWIAPLSPATGLPRLADLRS